MKICFDCGHYHCLTPGAPLIKDFGDKIEVLHLHDNHGEIKNGTGDEHLILGNGNLNLEDLANDLAQIKDDIVLCAEYRIAAEECNKEFFDKAKQSLDRLEQLILIRKKNR